MVLRPILKSFFENIQQRNGKKLLDGLNRNFLVVSAVLMGNTSELRNFQTMAH